MQKILMLTPQLPYPPHQGTSLRNLHLLRALALTKQVTLLSFFDSHHPQELGPLRELSYVHPPVPAPTRSMGERLRQLLTTDQPDIALRLSSEDYSDALVGILRADQFDAVQIEGIEMGRYIEVVRRIAPAAQIVLDCHNAETELQRRALRTDLAMPSRWPAAAYSGLQVGRLKRFETWAIDQADAVIAVSEIDRQILQDGRGKPRRDIFVIPNSIDIHEYDRSEPDESELKFDMVFTGKMDYRPNIDGILWFADEVWPLIVSRRPGTTMAVVGQRPHHRLDRLNGVPGITVTGRVPTVRPYLFGSKVYIVPIRIGSGTRLKLIEAMAAGKAIVSTTNGAEGFPINNGGNIILADKPEEFAQSVMSLLNHQTRREQLGAAAREFSAQYDWRRMAPLLEELYRTITKQG